MALPEIRCEFVLQGMTLYPQEVTDALGLEPSQTWQVGDPIAYGKGARRSNAWIIAVGPERAYDLDGLSSELIERLAPATQAIPELCRRLQLDPEIYAPVYIYDEFPNLKFPLEVVRWAAEVGATLAVDVFDLREMHEERSEPPLDGEVPSAVDGDV